MASHHPTNTYGQLKHTHSVNMRHKDTRFALASVVHWGKSVAWLCLMETDRIVGLGLCVATSD